MELTSLVKEVAVKTSALVRVGAPFCVPVPLVYALTAVLDVSPMAKSDPAMLRFQQYSVTINIPVVILINCASSRMEADAHP